MDIILDTNIYVGDFLLSSKKMLLVFDYLKKTNSKIIIPQLVYEELTELYERHLTERFRKLKEADESFKRMLTENRQNELAVDFKVETHKYLTFLKSRLKIKDDEIFPYKEAYLKNITYRAIRRIKPCTDKGEEFRDALLWLSVLDIARDKKRTEVIFISNNIHQFASNDNALHSDLIKEASDASLQVKYYCSIDAFIADHATRIDFITDDWIKTNLPTKTVEEEIIRTLELHGERRLLRWAEEHERSSPTGYYNTLSLGVDIDTFYVYERTDGSYYVEVIYTGEAEIEFEFDSDFDFQHEVFIKPGIKCLNPEITATFGIDIEGNQIVAHEITDWEIFGW